jgi:site-specific DNA recombinase
VIVDGYVRVSHVGSRGGASFISPALQREKIERWAALHDARLDLVFEELDESGARQDRPMLMEAIGRVEAGTTNGIVVAKLDRFGRSLRHGLVAIERITEAGGTLVSVEDGFDFGTDTGRLVLKIMLSMAEWELDRIRRTWSDSQRKAVERGACPGAAPVGYRRARGGRLEPDPVLGPVVTSLFADRAEGMGVKQLANRLTEQGVPTSHGGRAWQPSIVGRILKRRIYLGELQAGAYVNPRAHPALVDAATWARAQRSDVVPSHPRSSGGSVLQAMIRCASCGRVMHPSSSQGDRSYACGRRSAAGHCPRPVAISAAKVEPYVEAVFWQILDRAPARGRPVREAKLERSVATREQELCAYRDNPALPRTLGPQKFAAGLAVRAERLEAALVKLAQARREGIHERPHPDDLRRHWPDMRTDQRAAALRTVVDCVFVRPGQLPTETKVVLFARGRAPAGLIPYGEMRTPAFRPLLDEDCREATQLLANHGRAWPESKVRSTLGQFLASCVEWPRYEAFQAAGLALLYRQVELHGGKRRWAADLGLPVAAPRDPAQGWTDERIRGALDRFLAGRRTWPPTKDFASAGLQTVRLAVGRTGGPERWAREYGLTLDPAHRTRPDTWTDDRIAAELHPLLSGRVRWPPKSAFVEAGHGSLYSAIQKHGTVGEWAERFGVRSPPGRNRPATLWSEEYTEATLTALVHQHGRWPRFVEFRAAGVRSLYERLRRDGTIAEWAERLGV